MTTERHRARRPVRCLLRPAGEGRAAAAVAGLAPALVLPALALPVLALPVQAAESWALPGGWPASLAGLAVVAAAGLVVYLVYRSRGDDDAPAGDEPSTADPAESRIAGPGGHRLLGVLPAGPLAAGDAGAADPSAGAGLADYENFHRLVDSLDLSRSAQERSYIEVISAMVATAHARDHETIGHSFRVARYSVTLAREMDLDESTLTAVEWGALLHDVGKIGVPEHVLRKQGPLNEAEQAVMREHPRRGYQMLKSLLFLGTGLDVVLSHHERWDGRGYPNGLEGEEIPLSARIFAVVDTYDAITSDRPYRAARSHAAAVDELERVAGRQLDPRVVEAFVRIPPERLATLRDLTRPVGDDPDSASFRLIVDDEGEPRTATGC